MKVRVQALHGPWINHRGAYADPNALLPILAVSSKSRDKGHEPTSHEATKTRARIDEFALINILTQDPLAPASAASTLTVFAPSLLTGTLLTPFISTTVTVATTSSEQSTFISHPSTDPTVQMISRRPTPTPVPTSASFPESGFSILSIALTSAGEDISKETPLFGGTGFGEAFDQWPTIRRSVAVFILERAFGLDGAVNGWNVLGEYENDEFLYVFPPSSTHETAGAGNHWSGLTGVGTPNMNHRQRAPPSFFTVTRTMPTIDDFATTFNDKSGMSQRTSSFPNLESRRQPARSLSPESASDAICMPQSKVHSPRIPNIFAPFADQPLANHISFHSCGGTNASRVEEVEYSGEHPSPYRSNSRINENNLPKQRVQSIPQPRAESSCGQQVVDEPKKLPWTDSRTGVGSAQGSMYIVDRGLATVPKFLTHKSRYTPSSGRPLAPVAPSDLYITGLTIASDFPLPPVSNTSTLASYTSLPYAHSPHAQSKHDPTAATILPVVDSPSLLPYVTPESSSLGLANMGDLMLNSFGEAIGADRRHGNPDLREDLDSENKTHLKTGNMFSMTLGIVADPGIERASSIMVDITPIPHNPEDLDRQLSRTAVQSPVKTSASRNSDPEASASGTLYDPGQRLLSHIAP
ncbi:hypothetical protein BS47DRAFT_1387111 [Hydnum rufescens UP504]|uniref:Uncharacterized protein n=1 Tax=Hydnum rufescens UP504 TaxID=1448309 RepID=A0A9P6BAD3_9AGAM|nr:hypothetical protein BS47DRAFT_1387111 [Hydnum rufescens UP504]